VAYPVLLDITQCPSAEPGAAGKGGLGQVGTLAVAGDQFTQRGRRRLRLHADWCRDSYTTLAHFYSEAANKVVAAELNFSPSSTPTNG
jgi:hypothetical protein